MFIYTREKIFKMLKAMLHKYEREYRVSVEIEESKSELIPNIYKEIIEDLKKVMNL